MARKGKKMNWASEMVVITSFWVLLISFPAVDQNEWLPPDIVREVARIAMPANAEQVGRIPIIPERGVNTGDVTKQNPRPTRK
jgi:hypothetical protein